MGNLLKFSYIKAPIAIIGGTLIAFCKDAPAAVQDLWVWFIIAFLLDTLLGLALAVKNKKIDSGKMLKGITKLLGYASLFIIGAGLDHLLNFPYTVSLIAAGYILLTELTSIVENMDCLGIKIPMAIRKYLKQVEEEPEPDGNDANSPTDG